MPINYKDLKEELDDLLIKMGIPRILYYQSTKLRNYILIHHFESEHALRAIDLINQISMDYLNVYQTERKHCHEEVS